MRRKIYILALLFSLAATLSCGTRTEEVSQPTEETPIALQENKLAVKSYSRSGDLIEELYSELVNNNPVLKGVENDLVVVRTNSDELSYLFSSYDGKSSSYYHAAAKRIEHFKDSELKRRMVALIAESKSHYAGQREEVSSMVAQISQSNASINEYYEVMKIALTLPLIEKYQKENIPEWQPYREIMKEQVNLVNRIDSIIPKG